MISCLSRSNKNLRLNVPLIHRIPMKRAWTAEPRHISPLTMLHFSPHENCTKRIFFLRAKDEPAGVRLIQSKKRQNIQRVNQRFKHQYGNWILSFSCRRCFCWWCIWPCVVNSCTDVSSLQQLTLFPQYFLLKTCCFVSLNPTMYWQWLLKTLLSDSWLSWVLWKKSTGNHSGEIQTHDLCFARAPLDQPSNRTLRKNWVDLQCFVHISVRVEIKLYGWVLSIFLNKQNKTMIIYRL